MSVASIIHTCRFPFDKSEAWFTIYLTNKILVSNVKGNPMKPEQTFEKLRRLRLECGLTQDEVAVGVGISKTMVQRYEMGPEKSYHAVPSPATLMKLNWFFDHTPKLGQQPEPDADADEVELEKVSLDDLLAEIKRRGYQVTLQSVA